MISCQINKKGRTISGLPFKVNPWEVCEDWEV